VNADEQRIDQVINNLVGNAAKYSPLHTRVTVSVCQVDDSIQVDVADQGPGIPPAERIRIFEAFHQLENGMGARMMRGAGLGLAICKGLIEAHGGKIWIQNLPIPGTTVSFILPVAVTPEQSEK
jgi:two-component system sensor histidine kinase KdpD